MVIAMRLSTMKTITLEEKTFTTDDVINKVGCSRSTATKRIKNCKTIDELLSPIMPNKIRKFTIEGETFTVKGVSNKLNCPCGTAYNRLTTCKTIESLFREIGNTVEERNPHNKKMTDMNNSINKLLYGKW
jgi:hypothetical protein